MRNYQQEYFFLKTRGANYPMLEYAGHQPIANSQLFYSEQAIDNNKLIPLKYSLPIVKNPQLADVHFISFNVAISERLKKHLEKLNLKNVQFIPATIQDYSDEIQSGYFILHVHNLVRCADLEESEWDTSFSDPDKVESFDTLVLNNDTLGKIPLEDRLVIALEEENLTHIYHRSVVDHILQLRPTGIAFYCLAGFNGHEPFEDEFLNYIKS